MAEIKEIEDLEIFSYQLATGELPFPERQGALTKVMCEDSREEIKLKFTNRKGNTTYSHSYKWPPAHGVAVFRLGSGKEMGAPHCVVILSLNDTNPFMILYKSKPAFRNANEVVGILNRSLSQALARYYETISICPCQSKEGKEWAEKELNVYQVAVSHKTQLDSLLDGVSWHENRYRDSLKVAEDKKADVMALLHRLTDHEKGAKRVMKIQRAAIDAKMLVKPPHAVFEREFGFGKGRKGSSYSEYLNPLYKGYENDDEYKDLINLFKTYL